MARQQLYQGGNRLAPASGVRAASPSAAAVSPEAAGAGSGTGIAGLTRAAEASGEKILKILARDYQVSERARADGIALETERKFEEWKKNYRETRRGIDAANAQADFTAKFEELRRGAIKEFGGDPDEVFEGELSRELAKRALYALADGGAYELREREAFNESVLRGRLAGFERICAENPEDSARIDLEYEDLLAAWRERHPGLDDTEIRLKMAGTATRTRLDSLIAQGRLDAAEGLLQGGHSQADGFAGKVGGTANIRGMDSRTESLIRSAAARHGVEPELALAIAMQESGGDQRAVSGAGAVGVMQLMPGTAKELGVNPRDLAQNIEGGVRYFSGLLKDFGGDVRAALTAYNMGPAGYRRWRAGERGIKRESAEYADRVLGRVRDLSLTPMDRTVYGDRIAAARQKQAKEARDAAFALKASELGRIFAGEMDPSLRETRLYEHLAAIEDPATRLELEKIGRAQLAYEERARAAREARETGDLLARLNDVFNGGSLPAKAGQLRDEAASGGSRANDGPSREAKIYQFLASIQDPERRLKLEGVAREQLAYEARAARVADEDEAARLMAALTPRNLSPIDALTWLNDQKDISPGAREKVRDLITGKANKTTFANQEALNAALIAIDRGELQSQEERTVYAINHNLTPGQWTKLADYRGSMADVSLSRVQSAINAVGARVSEKELWSVYQQIALEIPRGRPATTADIQRAVAAIMLKGTAPDPDAFLFSSSSMTYSEAWKRGLQQEWLPNVDKADHPFLDALLREQGHKINDHNRKKAKKIFYNRPDSTPWRD